MVSRQSSRRDQVEPKKLPLIAIIAVASGIGPLPYLLLIDRVTYLLVVVPAAALMAFLVLRRLVTDATEEPSLGEWLLGAWSAVALPLSTTLFGFAAYGIGFGIAWVAGALSTLLGFAFPIDPPTWGYWASIPFAALFALVLPWQATQDLFYGLYPRTAGSRSAFFQLLGRRWTIILPALAPVAVLALMIAFPDLRGAWFAILLFVLIFYSAAPLARLTERLDKRQADIIENLARLLERAGYDVTRSPRTGKADIDPMIRSVDVLARSAAKAFAIEVKSPESSEPVEWREAAALRTASSVLRDELAHDPKAPTSIEPILVLVGAKPAPSLERFSETEHVAVLQITDSSILAAHPDAIATRLRAIGVPIPANEPSPSLGAV